MRMSAAAAGAEMAATAAAAQSNVEILFIAKPSTVQFRWSRFYASQQRGAIACRPQSQMNYSLKKWNPVSTLT
jgi:hypothetical protein